MAAPIPLLAPVTTAVAVMWFLPGSGVAPSVSGPGQPPAAGDRAPNQQSRGARNGWPRAIPSVFDPDPPIENVAFTKAWS
ncbi:hypothetical protein GCM10009642_03140 [Nocardiopsis metallicus]